jgi:zinc and cadmium transporter
MDVLLLWIIAFTTLGGVLGVMAASALLLLPDRLRERLMPGMVSFAIGTLLGAAFLALLPHALETQGVGAHAIAMTVLVALLSFFLLEKMVLWRHCHTYDCEVHGGTPDHEHTHVHIPSANGERYAHIERARIQATGRLILVGDGVHNLVDGVLIAAAFMTDVDLGIVTSLAVITHEIPQELGDFSILLMSGYSRARALLYNLLSGLTMVVGGIVAYFALSFVQAGVPYVLAVAAASFIYIAVADLIPGLHRRPELMQTAQQLVLIASGVGLILLAEQAVH